ncbi:MAG: phosphoenolpyruvate--protein phosphotransferase [Deltaproteobacteria bacterium]|jgi:phosphotransferase system enzyme I (PtsI)|nr:phosphoenolpyruvate--protein phosphotransferase [Deltaproteobacteria bacterium]
MITIQGKGVSSGIAMGPIVFLSRKSDKVERRAIEDPEKEIERFFAARDVAAKELDALALEMVSKIGQENALLFEIHRMMLEDTDYVDPILEIIRGELVNAEYAVNTAGSRLAQDFADMDDDYMKARSVDVYDVSKRVIGHLSGDEGDDLKDRKEPYVLAADDFTPSETAQLDRSKVLALVSRLGAANSHTAIFARTMGIPAIISFGAFLSEDFSGKNVILDGDTGVLYVEPEKAETEKLLEKGEKAKVEKERLEKFRGKPTRTKDGRVVKLYANIGNVEDAKAALAWDAEGIGLFRSEFLYLGRDNYPDEETQFESYKKVLEKMGGREVIIRTLDIGADKRVDYFRLPEEENPAMGMRAIRICLTRPDLFKTQLRAIYRASVHGKALVMFPMITSVSELVSAKELARAAREELAAKGVPHDDKVPLGIMIETPAAAIISDLLAKEADFFSIGTNDLTQYTLAMDRQNDGISNFLDIHHEAIMRLIKMTCENAKKAGIMCGICGSLGADPALTKTFAEIGIDELSVEPSVILKLRALLSEI